MVNDGDFRTKTGPHESVAAREPRAQSSAITASPGGATARVACRT
jgi:hypothetical protein